jgi:hypothetical protein
MSEKQQENCKTKVKYPYEEKYLVINIKKGSQNAGRIK